MGRRIRRKVKHTPLALRKSVLWELEEKFPCAFGEVRQSQFRRMEDIAPLTALYVNYAVATGRAVSTGIPYAYFDIGQAGVQGKLDRFIRRRNANVFCLNDTEEYPEGITWEEKEQVVRRFLEELYPWPAPWEGRVAQAVAADRGEEIDRRRRATASSI